MKAWMSSNFGQIPPPTPELSAIAPSFLIASSSFLQVTRTTIKSLTSSKFDQIKPWTAELAALEHLEKSPWTYNERNLVNTLAPLFLIGSSSFLQVTRTCIKAWISSNFGKIPRQIMELAALGRLKKSMYNVVNTLAPSFLIKYSSFLQVTRPIIKSGLSSKSSLIGPCTAELAALEHLEKSP